MTSEVLILNKHAVVLGADSAVTTTPARDGEHPRYSKTANKLFELTDHGSVASMIYGGAQIDGVPWELVIKLFRANHGSSKFPTLALYLDQLVTFVRANSVLFGDSVLESCTDYRFERAVKHVLSLAIDKHAEIFSTDTDVPTRQALWKTAAGAIDAELTSKGVLPSLSPAELTAALAGAKTRVPNIASQVAKEPELAGVDPVNLTELAVKALYSVATDFLPSTGVVVAGYGEQDIFPGFKSIEIFGHIGKELLVVADKEFQVSHTDSSMIQGLAQTSMIDVFTDGFGGPLWRIIRDQNRKGLAKLVETLKTAGIDIPDAISEVSRTAVHNSFMSDWTAENYIENWRPLKGVLSSLGVQEMAHLAETLLTLEALKERVTSSSESVGGPIDVAAITKSEGLIWLKRKHFFEPELNLRYITRLQRTLRQ